MIVENSDTKHMAPREMKDDLSEQLRQIGLRLYDLNQMPDKDYLGGAQAKTQEIKRLVEESKRIESFISSH